MLLTLALALQSGDPALQDLSSDSIELRDKAAQELRQRGWAAVPALVRLAQGEKGEAALRAEALLKDIASDALGRIRADIQKGEGLELAFQHRLEAPRNKIFVSGDILIGTRGRLRVRVRESRGLSESRCVKIVSDGLHMEVVEAGGGIEKGEWPLGDAAIAETMLRVGLPSILWGPYGMGRVVGNGPRPHPVVGLLTRRVDEYYRIEGARANFSAGAYWIECDLQEDGGLPPTPRARMRVDPERPRVLGRINVITLGGERHELVEDYSEWKVHAVLPDDSFKR